LPTPEKLAKSSRGSLLGTVRCQPVGVRKCQSINSTFSIISRPFVAFLAFGSHPLTVEILDYWYRGENPCCPLDRQESSYFRRHVRRKEERIMARKYGRKSQKDVRGAMHEFKRGKLKSGRSGRKVKSRKQAIAIGLSKARKHGAKVPPKSRSKSR